MSSLASNAIASHTVIMVSKSVVVLQLSNVTSVVLVSVKRL